MAGQGAGVDRQREACLKLAADRGWTVDPGHIITENDVSATRGKRPGYARLVQLAESGTVEILIGWAVDRLTRTPRQIEDLIDLSERTGCRIATVAGDLDLTTDAGRLVGRILGSVARGEVERKGARQKAANRQRAEQGKPPAIRCYGYQTDGTPHPTEADYVRQSFARFAAGATITGLARWLNEHGQLSASTRAAAAWSRFGVRGMLQNPRYVARRYLAGEYIGPGGWEPLVDDDLFAAVGARLRDPARVFTPGPARKWLGSGLYRCGVCDDDTRVQVFYQNWRGPGGTMVQGRRYACFPVRHLVRKADAADALVQGVICERLRRPDIAMLVADDRDVAAVRALRDESTGLRARLDGLAGDLADGLLTARQVKVASDRIAARLAGIEAKQAQHGRRSALAQISGADDPAVAWLALEVAQRAAVVDTLCTVTLLKGKPGRAPFDPETVRIEWRQS